MSRSSQPAHPDDFVDAAVAQAYLAAIVESSDDAILSKNLDGIVQSCNPAAERLFGYRRDELVGQSIRILIPRDRQAEEDEILARIRKGERVEHFETVRLTKDGQPIDISLTVSPVRDAQGHVIGVSKTARDITDRKRIEAALAAQQEWFRVTLSSIGDAVIATDADGRVVFMNPVAETLTGWQMNDACGRPCSEVFQIVHEHTKAAVENPVVRVLRDGNVVGLANHTLLISSDGSLRPIDDSGAPIRTGDSRIIGVVLVFRDVTDRRQLEQERDRTLEERERLLQAERAARAEAERANRLKDNFVATVSHELRTPLNAILGWTELMQRNRHNEPLMSRGLDVVERNTHLQTQLISDLLDISRIASGKLQLEIESVDLASVIDAAVETLQHTAQAKECAVECFLDRKLAPVAGDPSRLQQIVWNLLSNALKFSPKGAPVWVTLRQRDGRAEIGVEDTGSGIEAEFLPHVFERFRQEDDSAARGFGGLGLGLSIVKNLVDLHGGTVSADSRGKGQGATFKVTLPFDTRPDRTNQVRTVTTTGSGVEDLSLRDISVLVVEDDGDAADFVRNLLEMHHASVRTAATAVDALAILDAEHPDILISDISLPEIDGYQLMQRIRAKDGDGGATPAIALTAFARSEDRARALAAGFQTHLAKPIRANEVLATVTEFARVVRAKRKNPGT